MRLNSVFRRRRVSPCPVTARIDPTRSIIPSKQRLSRHATFGASPAHALIQVLVRLWHSLVRIDPAGRISVALILYTTTVILKRRPAWRCDLGLHRFDPDVVQDLAWFPTIVDEGDDAHGAAALRVTQRQHFVDAGYQQRPQIPCRPAQCRFQFTCPSRVTSRGRLRRPWRRSLRALPYVASPATSR